MKQFIQGYIECALWSSIDDNDMPLDQLDLKLSQDALKRVERDCAAFLDTAEAVLHGLLDDYALDQLGHDFWLTRNSHGAGFWDGDYPEPTATLLTELSKKFGSVDLYVENDTIEIE